MNSAPLPMRQLAPGVKDFFKNHRGLWIIRNRFAPGVLVQKHRHTGQVYGYTLSGAWKYAEYDYVNRAGSFLYEPAGSVHTLTVLDDNIASSVRRIIRANFAEEAGSMCSGMP